MNAVIEHQYRAENRAFLEFHKTMQKLRDQLVKYGWIELFDVEMDQANIDLDRVLRNHARWSVLQWRNCPDDNEIVWAALDSLIEEGKVKAIVDGDIVRYAPAGCAE